jgi:hypothetical protein
MFRMLLWPSQLARYESWFDSSYREAGVNKIPTIAKALPTGAGCLVVTGTSTTMVQLHNFTGSEPVRFEAELKVLTMNNHGKARSLSTAQPQ